MSEKDFQTYLGEHVKIIREDVGKIKEEINHIRKVMEVESRENFSEHMELKNIEANRILVCSQMREQTKKELETIKNRSFIDLFWTWFKRDWKFAIMIITFFNIDKLWIVVQEIMTLVASQ